MQSSGSNRSRRNGMTREEYRKARLRRRRRQIMLMRIAILLAFLLIIFLAVFLIQNTIRKNSTKKTDQNNNTANVENQQNVEADDGADDGAEDAGDAGSDDQAPQGDDQPDDAADDEASQEGETSSQFSGDEANIISQAAFLAAGYDYDGAIALLKTIPDYDTNQDVISAITGYETTKASCVAVDPNSVPHIFYHSLVNDPSRAFSVERLGSQFAVDGMNAWMTTVEEFDEITRQLYERGYVYVRLRDLVVETKDENGISHFTPNNHLMLPPDKKALVLSVDDLSYYHSYEPAGFPEKLVLDENGKVKCKYTDGDGNTTIGDYDVVPRLNTFLEEHPDGSYHGARGLIAMTGYDGVFGYRTDIDYQERQKLTDAQAAWLANHPDYDRDKEIAEATVIADAIKESGWEFASHTWGHLSVTNMSAEGLMTDNDRWVQNVGNIVGPTDTIIFAHGNDIGDWTDYTEDNAKYTSYRDAGYNFYCNVDGSVTYWVQIRDRYVRQGRINLDGYMLYRAYSGDADAQKVLSPLIDVSTVFDTRRPTPVVAQGMS